MAVALRYRVPIIYANRFQIVVLLVNHFLFRSSFESFDRLSIPLRKRAAFFFVNRRVNVQDWYLTNAYCTKRSEHRLNVITI